MHEYAKQAKKNFIFENREENKKQIYYYDNPKRKKLWLNPGKVTILMPK